MATYDTFGCDVSTITQVYHFVHFVIFVAQKQLRSHIEIRMEWCAIGFLTIHCQAVAYF